jgi:hypothetical protein
MFGEIKKIWKEVILTLRHYPGSWTEGLMKTTISSRKGIGNPAESQTRHLDR